MKASLKNPIYTTYVIVGNTKYDITSAVISLDFSDQEKQFAQSVNISVANTLTKAGWLSSLLDVRCRVYIYADDGERKDEVFRGFIWTRSYKSYTTQREITLKCYDHLIYWQESEDAEFFSAGKSSKDVISSFCSKWGVNLNYSYESITHSKLALRGTLTDIITSDVLDLVKDRTGKDYVILSEKDTVHIRPYGQNATIYRFEAKNNAVNTHSEYTMDGMTTKVVILGKADKDEREPVEATVSGSTGQYGTLQKIINRDENTTMADSKKEAQSIIDENGKPKKEYEVTAPDIPWVRKGDKVYVNAGDISKRYMLVMSLDRTITNTQKTISMILKNV